MVFATNLISIQLMKQTFRNLLTVIARLESPPDILYHDFIKSYGKIRVFNATWSAGEAEESYIVRIYASPRLDRFGMEKLSQPLSKQLTTPGNRH